MKIRLSLKWKLTILIAGGSAVAAAMASLGFAWLDLKRSEEHTRSEAAAIAAVIAGQTGPAIELGDRKAAAEILASMRTETLIRDALLYDAHGACFAAFHSYGSSDCPAQTPKIVYERRGQLYLAQPVMSGGDRLGTLVLVETQPSASSILGEYSGGAGLILLFSLLMAAIAGGRLQLSVSKPILEIASVAQRIASNHSFAERVAAGSGDELGVLANSFNAMLDEIERRDAELMAQRLSLEEEVAQRKRVNTELLTAKDKAEEGARLKSEFLANMSHEIRTPMNGVLGMIGLVLDNCPASEDRERLLAAQEAAQSLVAILNDILDLSKIEAGKMTYETIAFDLAGVVRDALRVFELPAKQKNVELKAIVEPGCPAWVAGDPVRLRQMLINLAGNAVKFTLKGSVTLAVSMAAADRIRFAVIDTGIGIPTVKLNAIFDAFTQADGSHTRQFGGTGLGLTITRRLAGLMGGRLWVESEAGRGSCFAFELPLKAAAPKEPEQPIQALDLPPHLRILVAEDNPVNQKVIVTLLKRQGCEVTLASNGRDAAAQCLARKFDVVLMDIQMPEVDGLEATRRIREAERSSSLDPTPIIALTAHAWELQQAEYLAAGMDGVITKPVSVSSLLGGISEVLARRPVAVAIEA
jgi:two-component system, sensor histidine kinase